MKNVGIITNVKKDVNLSFTNEIFKWLSDRGLDPINLDFDSCKDVSENGVVYCEEVYKYSDFIVVLGGDGTVLNAARHAALRGTPILGINIGTLGYLTDANQLDAFHSLQKIIDGNYKIDKRMMLQCTFVSNGESSEQFLCLNDFVITKGSSAKIITYELTINDEYVHTYRADGVVVATPTGSTAYNLSAGGPILKPDSSMIAITPVSPHMLFARPSVVSGNDEIKIKVTTLYERNAIFMIDGQIAFNLQNEDTIIIKKADCFTNIIKTSNVGYYNILHKKLMGLNN